MSPNVSGPCRTELEEQADGVIEYVSCAADPVRLVSHGRKLSQTVDEGYINHVGDRAMLLSTYTSPTTHQTIYPKTCPSNHPSIQDLTRLLHCLNTNYY